MACSQGSPNLKFFFSFLKIESFYFWAKEPSQSPTHTFVELTITITGVRDCGGSYSVQASGIIFYDLYGNELQVRSVSNPGGDNPNQEDAENLLDNDVVTKWNDLSIQLLCQQTSTLKFEVQEGVMGFSFITANDHPKRDPYAYDIQVCPHDLFCEEPLKYIEINIPSSRKTVYPVTSLLQCDDMSNMADKLYCQTMRVERIKHDILLLSEKTSEIETRIEENVRVCTESRAALVSGILGLSDDSTPQESSQKCAN